MCYIVNLSGNTSCIMFSHLPVTKVTQVLVV